MTLPVTKNPIEQTYRSTKQDKVLAAFKEQELRIEGIKISSQGALGFIVSIPPFLALRSPNSFRYLEMNTYAKALRQATPLLKSPEPEERLLYAPAELQRNPGKQTLFMKIVPASATFFSEKFCSKDSLPPVNPSDFETIHKALEQTAQTPKRNDISEQQLPTPELGEVITRLVSQNHSPLVRPHVLDLGCGEDINSHVFCNTLGCDVVGVDCDPKSKEIWERFSQEIPGKENRSFVLSDIQEFCKTQLKSSEQKFSLICSKNCLYSLPSIEAIREITRDIFQGLRTQGIFFLQVPAELSFSVDIPKNYAIRTPGQLDAVPEYSLHHKRYLEAVRDAGFTNIRYCSEMIPECEQHYTHRNYIFITADKPQPSEQ
jgi:SAM-dependent methyltransferase